MYYYHFGTGINCDQHIPIKCVSNKWYLCVSLDLFYVSIDLKCLNWISALEIFIRLKVYLYPF